MIEQVAKDLREYASEIAVVVALILTFALGRYSVETPKTSEVSHAETQKDKNTEVERTTTIVKRPGGDETTTVVERRRQVVREETKEHTTKETSGSTSNHRRWSVGVLGAFDFPRGTPVYGLSIQKEVLGPITAGVWGLNSGTIGISLGVNF